MYSLEAPQCGTSLSPDSMFSWTIFTDMQPLRSNPIISLIKKKNAQSTALDKVYSD